MSTPVTIQQFIKKGKNLVIDIDGVEYLVRDDSLAALAKGDTFIPVLALYESVSYLIAVKDILKSLKENGAIDYLEKKK